MLKKLKFVLVRTFLNAHRKC